MGLLGGSVTGAMQKSLRDNRALVKKRKSLKEISENYHEKKKDEAPVFKKISTEELEKFKTEFKRTKEKERIQRMCLLGGLVILGVIFLVFFI